MFAVREYATSGICSVRSVNNDATHFLYVYPSTNINSAISYQNSSLENSANDFLAGFAR